MNERNFVQWNDSTVSTSWKGHAKAILYRPIEAAGRHFIPSLDVGGDAGFEAYMMFIKVNRTLVSKKTIKINSPITSRIIIHSELGISPGFRAGINSTIDHCSVLIL